MRSEHGNSLHFISSAADFLHNNFQKKVDFLYINIPPKKPFFEKIKKIAPQNPGSASPRGVGPDVPTLAYPAIPKTVETAKMGLGRAEKGPFSPPPFFFGLSQAYEKVRRVPEGLSKGCEDIPAGMEGSFWDVPAIWAVWAVWAICDRLDLVS